MSEYAVARLEDIGEISDGREPWRPVRHHFGITSFGINAWTGRETGDRIINELEQGSAAVDEVDLLVLSLLVVLVDDPVSRVPTRPGVDPERRDAEVVAHRTPGLTTITDLADLLQVGDSVLAHRHSSKS